MMGEVHLLPGTTFSSIAARGDYKPADTAVMTMRELERWLTLQITGIYHRSLHRGLGRTPQQAWNQAMKSQAQVRLPYSEQQFYIDFLPYERRAIRRDGIRIFNIFYWTDSLTTLLHRSHNVYAVHYDPRDLSRVYVKDRQNEFIEVPYRTRSFIPITLEEQRWATRKLRNENAAVNEQAMFRAIAQRREMVEEAQKKTMRTRRSHQKTAYALQSTAGIFDAVRRGRSGNCWPRPTVQGRDLGMTSELGHLLPELRHEATLCNEERIRRIQLDRWISYPKAEVILARMSELLAYPPHDRMPALLIYGGTGMGKTKILRKFIRDYPAAFDDSVGITHMRVIHMQMPPEPDEKSFYEGLLDALGSPTNHYHTVAQLRRIARDLLQFVKARTLIIDELHSMLAGTHRQQQILLNTLRFLANDIKLPLICAGTGNAKRALMTDQQLADSFEIIELSRWRNDEAFNRLLASFLGLLPLRQQSDLLAPAVRKALLDHSDGVTVRIVRLIEALAIDAIRSGRERIDMESFSVVPSLPLLLSMEDRSHAGIS